MKLVLKIIFSIILVFGCTKDQGLTQFNTLLSPDSSLKIVSFINDPGAMGSTLTHIALVKSSFVLHDSTTWKLMRRHRIAIIERSITPKFKWENDTVFITLPNSVSVDKYAPEIKYPIKFIFLDPNKFYSI